MEDEDELLLGKEHPIMNVKLILNRNQHRLRLVPPKLKIYPIIEGVVAQWCNPLTLKPEQSGGVGSSPGRTPPLERHDKGSRTRLGLLYFCDPSVWR